MSRVAIQLAFDARMVLFATGSVSVAHKADLQAGGATYTPVPDRPYYAARLAAYTANPMGTGPTPVVREDGSYQVTIHRPVQEGERVIGLIAKDLCAFFKRAQPVALVAGTTDQPPITIVQSSEGTPYVSGGWIIQPVLVTWFTGA